MEKKSLFTDNAACGLTDISGVKEMPSHLVPEQGEGAACHVAGDQTGIGELLRKNESANVYDEGKTGPAPSEKADLTEEGTVLSADAPKSVTPACAAAEEENEDKEFLALIKGK